MIDKVPNSGSTISISSLFLLTARVEWLHVAKVRLAFAAILAHHSC